MVWKSWRFGPRLAGIRAWQCDLKSIYFACLSQHKSLVSLIDIQNNFFSTVWLCGSSDGETWSCPEILKSSTLRAVQILDILVMFVHQYDPSSNHWSTEPKSHHQDNAWVSILKVNVCMAKEGKRNSWILSFSNVCRERNGRMVVALVTCLIRLFLHKNWAGHLAFRQDGAPQISGFCFPENRLQFNTRRLLSSNTSITLSKWTSFFPFENSPLSSYLCNLIDCTLKRAIAFQRTNSFLSTWSCQVYTVLFLQWWVPQCSV